MRNLIFVFMFLISMPLSAQDRAGAFVTDLDYPQVLKKLSLDTVGDLTADGTGYVDRYGFEFCREGKVVKIPSHLMIISDGLSGNAIYYISKMEDGRFEIGLYNDTDESYKSVVTLIEEVASTTKQCSEYTDNGVEVLEVGTIFERKNLTSLFEDDYYITVAFGEDEGEAQEEQNQEPEMLDLVVFNEWQVKESISPIDDSPKVIIKKLDSGLGESLILRCIENKTTAYIATDYYLGYEDILVTYRFDSNKPQSKSLGVSTDKDSFFFNRPVSFLKRMIKSKQLVVRFTPSRKSTQTLTFDLTGLEEAIAPLRKACHW